MTVESEKLREVGLRILSDWGMMLVDEPPKGTVIFESAEPLYMAWVNMRGACKGTLSIVAQPKFMETLTRNLLGLEPDAPLTSADRCDAFKELGNVLAGNFFTAAFGEDVVFDLIYPNVVEIDHDEIRSLERRGELHQFLADDTPVAMTFTAS